MKKTILTIALAFIVSACFAQSKTKVKNTDAVKKPNLSRITISHDTANYIMPAKDLAFMVNSTSNLLYLLKQGQNDVTPNQVRAIIRTADSLQVVYATWYNKYHSPKPAKP